MYDTSKLPLAIRQRIQVEKRIVKAAVTDLLLAGYALSVFDGEEESKRFDGVKLGLVGACKGLFDALMNTDEDYLFVWDSMHAPVRHGWVKFVYGNDGWDVISDYTTNLERELTRANAMVEKLDVNN